jgi:hypothetical protein
MKGANEQVRVGLVCAPCTYYELLLRSLRPGSLEVTLVGLGPASLGSSPPTPLICHSLGCGLLGKELVSLSLSFLVCKKGLVMGVRVCYL